MKMIWISVHSNRVTFPVNTELSLIYAIGYTANERAKISRIFLIFWNQSQQTCNLAKAINNLEYKFKNNICLKKNSNFIDSKNLMFSYMALLLEVNKFGVEVVRPSQQHPKMLNI